MKTQIIDILKSYKKVFFFEECMKCGSIAEHLGVLLLENNFKGKYIIKAIENKYVHHNTVKDTLRQLSLDSSGIVNVVSKECLN